jgi:hypothetical protein
MVDLPHSTSSWQAFDKLMAGWSTELRILVKSKAQAIRDLVTFE